MRGLRSLLLLAALLLSPCAVARAQDLPKVPGQPDVQARLLVGGHDDADPGTLWLGLEVTLGQGWKTYWRSPGDGGLPPELDWRGSTNIGQPEMLWPTPHRMNVLGLESFGYTQRVLFPIRVHPPTVGTGTRISLDVALYVCSTLCVRDEHQFKAAIGPGDGDAVSMALIQDGRGRLPGHHGGEALRLASVGVADGDHLVVRANSARGFGAPDAFIEWQGGIVGPPPEVRLSPDGHAATLSFPLPPGDGAEAIGKPVTLTLVDGTSALEQDAVLQSVPPVDEVPGLSLSILLLAFAGGLILNLMPCVLPVLSLKLMSVIRLSDASRGEIRRGFTATAAGIVASFLVLAAAMIGLKAAGAVVGWGIQFQQPLFLTAMSLLLILFAANLFGLFELPAPVMSGRGAKRAGLLGEFGTGMMATLLATPCSAPFIGTAIGFALARGPLEIGAIFMAMGLGMAVPYLVAALFPGLVRLLPRPGRWMLTLRRTLAVLLLGTAAWLVWVIAGVAGAVTALVVGAALLVVLALIAVRRRISGPTRSFLGVTAGALAILLLLAQPGMAWLLAPPEDDALQTAWRPFDADQIPDYVQAGRTVLVDVTAAWCITCKVNERLVLDSAPVVRRLDEDVLPMRADWTRPNPAIARFLQAHGRYGIPFAIVFGPRAPDGIVLPELLSTEAVLDALDRASAPASHNGIAFIRPRPHQG